MTTYEKIVKGATKVKVAAPKPKYIEPILMSTSIDHAVAADNFNTVMRTLQVRLQDHAWSVVYKSLIVIHILIREGDRDVTLNYLCKKAPNMLNLTDANISKTGNFSTDVRFIIKYSKYLNTRVKQFHETEIDYVRDERSNNSSSQTGGRLRSLTVEKGLLRETESVQKQIDALLKNNFVENEINNDLVLTAFRLLVNDLLALFQELNEGVINLLEHYFEMSKYDAERALKIYKKFVDQTKYVIDYLRVAKHLEYATKLHVPTIKHAPTALTSSLEEYLDDPNFEVNRRQYLAEKSGKTGGPTIKAVDSQPTQAPAQAPAPTQAQAPITQPNFQDPAANGQRESLIVQQATFNPWGGAFALVQQPVQSVQQQTGFQQVQQPVQQQQIQQPVQQQQTGFQQPVQQQTGFQQPVQQQTGFQQPVQQINPAYTGVGFGGYGPQVQQQPTGSNPFMLQPTNGYVQQNNLQQIPQAQPVQQFQQTQNTQPLQAPALNRTNTNPFAGVSSGTSPIKAQSTNPFANSRFTEGSNTTALSFASGSNGVQAIAPTSTGSNPFKVSQTTSNLFNSAQAQSQQQTLKPQATAGGLENLPTIAVFPQTQQEQQRNMYLQGARTGLQQQATSGFNQQFVQQHTMFSPQQQYPQQFGQQPIQQQQTFGQPVQQHYEGPSLI